MSYESLIVTREAHISVVTLNRPEKLNSIDNRMHLEMIQVCQELNDDDVVRASPNGHTEIRSAAWLWRFHARSGPSIGRGRWVPSPVHLPAFNQELVRAPVLRYNTQPGNALRDGRKMLSKLREDRFPL